MVIDALILIVTVVTLVFPDGVPPAQSHPMSNQKHKPIEDDTKHQGTSKPAWLLALEIVTGTMVGSLFLVAILTAMQKCNSKASIVIPWKKSASEKDHISVYIGQISNYICLNPIEDFELLYVKKGIYFLCDTFTDSEMLKDVVKFSRQELEVACEDFSNIIGSSPDSLVYKGNMKGGPEIAVISLCIKEEFWTGYLELYFQREVIPLSSKNLPA